MKIDWDATRYAQRLPKQPANTGTRAATDAEARLRRRYPPQGDSAAARVTVSHPCIVVDMDNVILAWYLPDILSDSRQVTKPIHFSDLFSNLIHFRVQ